MQIPLDLPEASSILVAGAGGFDVVCALPVALALRAAGHRVHLASYAFTALDKLAVEQPFPQLYRVHDGVVPAADVQTYCPEVRLARWWAHTFGEPCDVWSYKQLGVRPLEAIFDYLQNRLDLNAILVLDAGVDGLFHGDEYDEATPSIDAVSIAAAWQQKEIRRYYAFTAFGTEGREYSVRHVDALEHMAWLQKAGGFLGVAAMRRTETVARQFVDCVDSIHSTMERTGFSIMASSIVASLEGSFGETVVTVRTNTAPIWISALTGIYWFYELDAVASISQSDAGRAGRY